MKKFIHSVSMVFATIILLTTAATASYSDCELQGKLAYNLRLMKEKGNTDDELIDWALKVLDANDFGKNADRAFITLMSSIALLGTPQQVANFIFDNCMDNY